MRIDRHPQEDIVARVPQMAARIDPLLHQVDTLLDDERSQLVRVDVGRRRPRTVTCGRPSTPGETLWRLLLRKQAHTWSVQDTEDQVDQHLILRWCCRLGWHETPDDPMLMRWAHTLQPETRHRLVERTAAVATPAAVTTGRTRRIDGTCVHTEIPHPTDSGRLVDRVRTLSRRVVAGAKGPSDEQGMRLVEPHTRAVLRHTRRNQVAFGRQVLARRAWMVG